MLEKIEEWKTSATPVNVYLNDSVIGLSEMTGKIISYDERGIVLLVAKNCKHAISYSIINFMGAAPFNI